MITKDGNILMEAENKVKRWKKYLEQLYNGNLGESVFENEHSIEIYENTILLNISRIIKQVE